jgi:hypothetical protein
LRVWRPKGHGSVLVTNVKNGVVWVLSEGNGLTKLCRHFGHKLTCRYILVFKNSGGTLKVLVGSDRLSRKRQETYNGTQKEVIG